MNWGFVRVVACIYALAGASGFSQSPVRPSLSLDVKVVSSGGEVRSSSTAAISRKMDYVNNRVLDSQNFSSTRERESQTALEISVRNFGRTPQTAIIETLYFGKPVRGSQLFVINSTSETKDLPSAGTIQLRSSSASVRSVSEKQSSLQTNPDPYANRQTIQTAGSSNTGGKLYGWIVRVLVDGEVIQTRASNPTLDQLAKNQGALDALRGPKPLPSLQRLPGRLQ
ncbi:hypothetical protein ACXR0O_24105 [Verrucomicrobiota bacterium sgz303538]